MDIKVHRGTKEIGGTCLEITASNGKVLWIDLGAPLDTKNPDISYAEGKVDALLISHPHQDHYGLMRMVGDAIPIYIGGIGLDLIKAVPMFVEEVEPYNLNFRVFKAWEEFSILETFKIKPYLTDHSTPEAFSFLIEADGQRIFYSGDYRATGRKGQLYDKFISNPPKNIDVLFTEGTMVKRENHKFQSEQAIEEELVSILESQKSTSFLLSSAQNIDRMVSCYNACKRTGKILVVDAYTAWLMEQVSKVSSALPVIERNEVRVFISKSQRESLNRNGMLDFLKKLEQHQVGNKVYAHPENYLYFTRCPNEEFLGKVRSRGTVNIIYSQWQGYLEKEYKQWFTKTVNKLKLESQKSDSNIKFHFVHTSGHAVVEDLVKYVKAVDAKKVVPIHTAYPEDFKNLLDDEGIKAVEIWNDNSVYTF